MDLLLENLFSCLVYLDIQEPTRWLLCRHQQPLQSQVQPVQLYQDRVERLWQNLSMWAAVAVVAVLAEVVMEMPPIRGLRQRRLESPAAVVERRQLEERQVVGLAQQQDHSYKVEHQLVYHTRVAVAAVVIMVVAVDMLMEREQAVVAADPHGLDFLQVYQEPTVQMETVLLEQEFLDI